MCNRLVTPEEKDLYEYTKRNNMKLFETQKFYAANAYVRPMLPVQLSSHKDCIGAGIWGLIPGFIQGEREADQFYRKFHTYNAVSEKIFTTASYKNYIGSNRALLYVKGFYEPHRINAKTSLPYYVTMAEQPFFTLGCVFSLFELDNGSPRVTFSIITTEGNDLLKRVYIEMGRMPLIIAPEDRDRWLSDLSRPEIEALMVPYRDGELQAYQVSRDLYRPGMDTERLEILSNVGGEVWR